MALAIGMLLDNSVVVLENIYRLSGNGYTPERSVTQGTKEVWRSIVAATLTTITVFLPFVFSDNFLIKLIGHHIGVSIISTLTISLFVALLFIPMITYLLLKSKSGNSVVYEKVSIVQRPMQVYLVLLKTCMRNPGVTVFGAVILLFATLILSLTLNVQQMKEVASDRFNISVVMPTGSTLENTDKIVKVLEERLEDFPEKKDLICRIREKEATLTGTAEKTSIDLENNAWMVAFAPYDDPQIAVCVYIPHGYSGSYCSITIREVLNYYLEHMDLDSEDIMPPSNALAY